MIGPSTLSLLADVPTRCVDRSYRSQAPRDSRITDIDRSLVRCGGDGQESHYPTIHADASETTQGSPEDEYVHFISGATNSRPSLKQEDTNKIQNLRIELSINLAPKSINQYSLPFLRIT